MKAIYRKYVAQELEIQLKQSAPEYRPHVVRLTKQERANCYMVPGEMVFARDLKGKGALFLSFVPHQRQETLLLDLGWSTTGKFPFAVPRTTPQLSEGHPEFRLEEFMIYFGVLYHALHGEGFWGWEVWKCSVDPGDPRFMEVFVKEDLAPITEQDAAKRAQRAVSDAMKDLKEVALPYLDQYAQSRFV